MKSLRTVIPAIEFGIAVGHSSVAGRVNTINKHDWLYGFFAVAVGKRLEWTDTFMNYMVVEYLGERKVRA